MLNYEHHKLRNISLARVQGTYSITSDARCHELSRNITPSCISDSCFVGLSQDAFAYVRTD